MAKSNSSKQTETHTCSDCESEFKLVFDLQNTQGYPKFCPFCSAEFNFEEEEDDFDSEEE